MSEEKSLRSSRIYWSIVNPDRVRRTPGRDGIALKGKVMRVPRDVGEELDNLIANWEQACLSKSPRYHFALTLLEELKELFPLPKEV